MDIFKQKVDNIFNKKRKELEVSEREDVEEDKEFKPSKEYLPFEVNQTIKRIDEETQRRKKVLKRKET
jgi:hypothetical protein